MRVAVVVLGDLGRSPRMLSHALSLAREGHGVELVGYDETPLPRELRRARGVRVWPLPSGRSSGGAGLRASMAMVLRGARLAFGLGRVLLWKMPRPGAILVQAPPGLPTVAVALLAGRIRGARVVVDWHNLGWTIQGLRFGAEHLLVRAAAAAERRLGRAADGHVAVSRCLAEELGRLGIGRAAVLYDRAPDRFFDAGPGLAPGAGGTAAVVVCPMGWTLDDDLDLLLEALRIWSGTDGGGRHGDSPGSGTSPAGTERSRRRVPLRLVLSGTGPQRDRWADVLEGLRLPGVEVEMPFVSPDRYPALLAGAHVGLSLHRSSSGLDLPMKIVEMRAVGLPVLALDYGPCLSELLGDGEGARRFRTAGELVRVLEDVLDGFPDRALVFETLRREARSRRPCSWHESWVATVPPLLGARIPASASAESGAVMPGDGPATPEARGAQAG